MTTWSRPDNSNQSGIEPAELADRRCPGRVRNIHAWLVPLLRNELYTGQIVWRRRLNTKDPSSGATVRRDAKPESFVYGKAPHLRIIDDDLWQRVQQRLAVEAAPETPGRLHVRWPVEPGNPGKAERPGGGQGGDRRAGAHGRHRPNLPDAARSGLRPPDVSASRRARTWRRS